MKNIQRRIPRSLAVLAALAFLAPARALAQELPPVVPGGEADPRAELEELFKKVELRLRRMSQLLGQASAGDSGALSELGGAGIDELIREAERPPASPASTGLGSLLEATQDHGQELVREIDRVLEIAREQAQQQQQQQSGGGSSQSPPQPSGQQPQQGQTPEGSRQMEGERAPRPGEEQGQQPDGQQPQQQPGEGEEPRGNQDNPEVTPEQLSDDPAAGATGAQSGAQDIGQWGDLPVHVRSVFRNGVSEDVPPRYRDWIDAYHRKLSTRSRR